jgi:GR25 family glycosyltransferase involved in LPS biosynthesis
MNILTLKSGKTILPMCINLETSKDRKHYVQSCCSSFNFPINFLKAVDKNFMIDTNTGQPIKTEKVVCGGSDVVYGVTEQIEITITDLQYSDRKYMYCPPSKYCKIYKPYVHSLYVAAIGCAFSHLECMRSCFEAETDFVLILEDDIAFANFDYQSELSMICNEQFDICIVGSSPQKQYLSQEGGFSNEYLYETSKNQWYSGASAYLASREFVQKRYPFDFVFCAADEFFGYAQLEMDATILALKTPIFQLSDHSLETTNPTN